MDQYVLALVLGLFIYFIYLFHLYLSSDTEKMKIDIQYRNKKIKPY